MLHSESDDLWLLISFMILALWVVFLVRGRAKARLWKEAHEIDDEPLVGTAEDLVAAENAIRTDPFEVRPEILKEYVLLDRFSTLHGFTQKSVEDLQASLESEGFRTQIHFQETLPLGTASVGTYTGMYELYVHSESNLEQARGLIDKYLGR